MRSLQRRSALPTRRLLLGCSVAAAVGAALVMSVNPLAAWVLLIVSGTWAGCGAAVVRRGTWRVTGYVLFAALVVWLAMTA